MVYYLKFTYWFLVCFHSAPVNQTCHYYLVCQNKVNKNNSVNYTILTECNIRRDLFGTGVQGKHFENDLRIVFFKSYFKNLKLHFSLCMMCKFIMHYKYVIFFSNLLHILYWRTPSSIWIYQFSLMKQHFKLKKK